MASRKLLVDRISIMDKNLMLFLLFSFVQTSVGQQSGESVSASSGGLSVSGTLFSTSDSTTQPLPSVHPTSSPYVQQTSILTGVYTPASTPPIATTTSTSIGATPTTTLTTTGITSVSTVATPTTSSATLTDTVTAQTTTPIEPTSTITTPTSTITTPTSTITTPTSTVTTPTSTITTPTSTVTTPTSTITTPTSTITTPTSALTAPNTTLITTTTTLTTPLATVPTIIRPTSTMVKVPPGSTVTTLPQVLFLAIPVGLGLLLVSTVIILCGAFVCVKRKSKYAKEEATAINREADGFTLTKRKDSDCQAEWNNIDCTKFELPVETVDTFGVTRPKSTGESLPDLQSTVTTHGCQTNEALVTNREWKAISTSRMKPSLSVGALGVRNPMYDVRNTADEMGLIVNEQPPSGHAYISKRAVSTGALYQHSAVNMMNQHPPSDTNTSQYYQVPSSLPVSDSPLKPNPQSSAYDVPRSARNAWLAEASNAMMEQLRVQFPSHYDVPKHALATARQQLEQQNMQREIPDPIPCVNPLQQGPYAATISDDSKPDPYSTYDVPRQANSSTLPSNQLSADAEHYDVPREWLEEKLALMSQRSKQTRNRSYTAFSKPDGVYDVPRQMLPLKVANNEQARLQMVGILPQHHVHRGNFDGVAPPIPRHGRWSDDDSDSENLYDEPPISPQMNNAETHYFPRSSLSDSEELYAEPPQESVAEVIQLGILEERIARAKRGNVGGYQVNQTIKHEGHNPDTKRICSRSQSFKEVHQQLQKLIMRTQQPTQDSQVNPTATELSSEVANGHRLTRQLSEKRLPPPVKQKPPGRSPSLQKVKSATLS